MVVCPNTVEKEKERKKEREKGREKGRERKGERKEERRKEEKDQLPCACSVKFKYVIMLNHIILKDSKSIPNRCRGKKQKGQHEQ